MEFEWPASTIIHKSPDDSPNQAVLFELTAQWNALLLQIYGWIPEPYNSTKLPADMPTSLKNYINESSMSQKEKDGMIWFNCEGENPADIENIGPITYYPRPGVPEYFFPYKNQAGYRSPAVFAHFENPKRN